LSSENSNHRRGAVLTKYCNSVSHQAANILIKLARLIFVVSGWKSSTWIEKRKNEREASIELYASLIIPSTIHSTIFLDSTWGEGDRN